jgi:uncharacterized repeat protein (TIGR01451 family)
LPPIADEPEAETPKKGAKKKGGRLVPAPLDPEVIRIQAAGDANAPAPAPAASSPPATVPAGQAPAPVEGSMEGQGSPLSTDRLPLGKQEVMVSVDVQSPANLNFEQPATVKIIVKNSGSTDALGVVVRDELPPGLDCLSSQPEAQRVGNALLSWRISTLPAGSDRVILLKVKPTKVGAFDHAATVTFQAGSKATSRVLRPRLKVEVVQNPTEGKVLKNKTAEFRIAITNTGDGPARNVIVHAKLSPGLRHDSSERNEDNSFELPIQQLSAGQREELDPLTVDALQGGPQWCRVNATSTDVVFAKEEAEVTRNIEVVEPKSKSSSPSSDWLSRGRTSATPIRWPRTRSPWRMWALRRPGTYASWPLSGRAVVWSRFRPAPSTIRLRAGCNGPSPRSTPARSPAPSGLKSAWAASAPTR